MLCAGAQMIYAVGANVMLHKKHKIHFVGIGGIGMSGIAEVLLN